MQRGKRGGKGRNQADDSRSLREKVCKQSAGDIEMNDSFFYVVVWESSIIFDTVNVQEQVFEITQKTFIQDDANFVYR